MKRRGTKFSLVSSRNSETGAMHYSIFCRESELTYLETEEVTRKRLVTKGKLTNKEVDALIATAYCCD